MAIGFATTGDPVIWDIGASALRHFMLAQATLASRTGDEMDPMASACDGSPTTGPVAALGGAFAVPRS